jgi:hypothetical protein
VFAHLRTVIVQPMFGLDVDDDTLYAMAVAWPAIEKLVLGVGSAQIYRSPRATLSALVPFSQRCPNLYCLGVVFDATLVPPLATHVNHRHGALSRLLVGASPVLPASVMDVAKFIVALFPSLETIVCADGHAQQRAWTQIIAEVQASRYANPS